MYLQSKRQLFLGDILGQTNIEKQLATYKNKKDIFFWTQFLFFSCQKNGSTLYMVEFFGFETPKLQEKLQLKH
jgi:hypothetical protein